MGVNLPERELTEYAADLTFICGLDLCENGNILQAKRTLEVRELDNRHWSVRWSFRGVTGSGNLNTFVRNGNRSVYLLSLRCWNQSIAGPAYQLFCSRFRRST